MTKPYSPNSPLQISLIVPVHNNPKDLVECISALKREAPPYSEIFIVDDGSTDNTGSVAEGLGVTVLRLRDNVGTAAARNHGARHASGEILCFMDSDVVVAPNTIAHITQFLTEHPEFAGIFGSYDARPRAEHFVSQYRNLLHHYFHQIGQSEASTFWAGCGALRRSAFEMVSGFNDNFTTMIEDVELGYRLKRAGYRIRLDKTLQVTHLKRWTFKSMIKTDIMKRAIPWSRLILETKEFPNDLNVDGKQRVSVALVMMGVVLIFLAGVWRHLLWAADAVLLITVLLNRPLLTFLFRQRGLRFPCGCIPIYLLYYLYSGIAFMIVWFELKVWNQRKTPILVGHKKE